jgi:hypothetical protein
VRDGIDLKVEIASSRCVTQAIFKKYIDWVSIPAVMSNRGLPGCKDKPAIFFCDNCSAHCSDEAWGKLTRCGSEMSSSKWSVGRATKDMKHFLTVWLSVLYSIRCIWTTMALQAKRSCVVLRNGPRNSGTTISKGILNRGQYPIWWITHIQGIPPGL